MAIDLKLIDQLLADYKKPEDIIGENGLLKQLTKAVQAPNREPWDRQCRPGRHQSGGTLAGGGAREADWRRSAYR